MPYSGTIDETTPAGTDDARTADDQIRALKLALKERLELIFTDINEYPMRLRAIWAEDSIGNYVAAINSLPASDSIELGNGDAMGVMIHVRSSLLGANISNNGKIYFCNHDGNPAHMLIVHQGSQRFYANLTSV